MNEPADLDELRVMPTPALIDSMLEYDDPHFWICLGLLCARIPSHFVIRLWATAYVQPRGDRAEAERILKEIRNYYRKTSVK
jgi:hypothetical protein